MGETIRVPLDELVEICRSHVASASPLGMSCVCGMFGENDLLSRYPEVAQVCRQHPEWAAAPYAKNKVFFACHAVSLRVDDRPQVPGFRHG